MLGVMEKTLESKNIPWGFELCFNSDCPLRDKCLHFCEDKLVQKAWGFSKIYKNVPHYLRAEARRCVKNYFSSGCGPYYRYHHGENKLSPRQQQDILKILAKYGPTDGLAFDHYETAFNFG